MEAQAAGRAAKWPQGQAGEDWWYGFKKRHKLRLRSCQVDMLVRAATAELQGAAAAPGERVAGGGAGGDDDVEGQLAAALRVPKLPKEEKGPSRRAPAGRRVTGPQFTAQLKQGEDANAAEQRAKEAAQQQREPARRERAVQLAAEKQRRAAAAEARRVELEATRGMSRAQLAAEVTRLRMQLGLHGPSAAADGANQPATALATAQAEGAATEPGPSRQPLQPIQNQMGGTGGRGGGGRGAGRGRSGGRGGGRGKGMEGHPSEGHQSRPRERRPPARLPRDYATYSSSDEKTEVDSGSYESDDS